ncbi:VCBS domain-containing protein [Variovorax rhizosphaerae]|uniref:VCBS domain-containing protein n=1 Tax=Variovorax rhizosphaerae TaxID=1836200 RepID=A0ABU8WC69_9BURK
MFDGAAFVEAAASHHAADGQSAHHPAPDAARSAAPHDTPRDHHARPAEGAPPQPAESKAPAAAPPVDVPATGTPGTPATSTAESAVAPPAIEVYVIDKSVSHWESLAAALPAGSQVILLDSDRSGTAQIAEELAGKHGIGALHILGHGTSEGIVLGNQTLAADSLGSAQGDLQRIGAALTAGGDILLYGSDVAARDTRFIDRLAQLTRADVAASTGATGAAVHGGDWTLEATRGKVETAALSVPGYAGLLTTAMPPDSVAGTRTTAEDTLPKASGSTVSDAAKGDAPTASSTPAAAAGAHVRTTGATGWEPGASFGRDDSTLDSKLSASQSRHPDDPDKSARGYSTDLLARASDGSAVLEGRRVAVDHGASTDKGASTSGDHVLPRTTPPANDAPVVTASMSGLRFLTDKVNAVPFFSVSDPDLLRLSEGETDFMQVTVRLLDTETASPLASYAGITIAVGGLLGGVGGHDGNNTWLTVQGTLAQVNAALAALTLGFDSDRDALFLVQVIADDRLRDDFGDLVDQDARTDGTQAGANGGQKNEPPGGPGTGPLATVPGTDLDWGCATVPPPTDPLAGNISAAWVMIGVSSCNEPATLVVACDTLSVYEDQGTRIGKHLDIDVSDPESEAFGTPVTVTLALTDSGNAGTIGVDASSTVDIAGNGSRTITLTGTAIDITALLRSLTYVTAHDINHDVNGAGKDGDVTLTVTLSDQGSRFGGDGKSNVVDSPQCVAITLVPVNDAPTFDTVPSAAIEIVGTTAVPGFVVNDIDITGHGIATGETDFLQVTVRLADSLGVPLPATGAVSHAHATLGSSAAEASGATVDSLYDGVGSALVVRGTRDQVNAYLAGLQVAFDSTLANSDATYKIEVIADDRLRDTTDTSAPALDGSGLANGGKDPARHGTRDVPTTEVTPYAAIPPDLCANVAVACRTLVPTPVDEPAEYNDPAAITVTAVTVNERSATLVLDGTRGNITVADPDDEGAANLQATVTLPPGFTFSAVGGAGGTVSGIDTTTVTLVGTESQINSRLHALTIALPDPAGEARPSDWNGSFQVTVVYDDMGNTGLRPVTLTQPDSGTASYEDGTSNHLITTQVFTVTVKPVNDAPKARDDARTVHEDGDAITGNVVRNGAPGDVADIDRDSDVLTVTRVRTGPEAGSGTAGTVGTDLVGQYGTLHLDADGSYTYTLNNADPRVQALAPGETVVDVFTYTVSDGKLSDKAQLCVKICGADDEPTLTVTDTNGGATGQLTVSERGLDDPADSSETASGSLTITAPDGIASVDIHGTVITLTQLQAATPASPITIDTDHGQIVITGFTATTTTTAPNGDALVTAGTVDYSYTLTRPLDHVDPAERTDVVPVTVTDRDGSTATGALTVLIQDDTPDARPDTNTIAEDTVASVGGNVFTNDRIGGDGPVAAGPVTSYSANGNTSATVGAAVTGQFGSIAINADGSYTYTLDNTNPAVNALNTGDSLTETVSYTLTDHDGDTSTATLTITIQGHTDGEPTITPVDGNGPDTTGQATVSERGLVDGSGSQTTTGSIAIDARDGLTGVTVGGTSLSLAQLQALGQAGAGGTVTIDTGEGTLVLTGFSATPAQGSVTGATLSYTYTLKAPITNAPGATESTDSIALGVSEADGGTGSGTLVVRIVDDVPEAVDDTDAITEDAPANTVSGNVRTNDTQGADVVDAATGVPVTAVTFDGTDMTVGTAFDTLYGQLALNADGSYTYTLNNADPRVQALVPGETLTESVSYTLTDHDSDTSTATLTITINGANDDPTVTVTDTNGGATGQLTVSERGLDDPADSSETASGSLTITAPDGIASVDIHGTVITLTQLQAATPASPITIETDHGQIVITGFTGTATTTAPNGDTLVTAGTVTYTYTLTQPLDHVDPAERTDVVPVKVTDRDGSTVTGSLTVLIRDDTPDARPDTNTIPEDTTSVGGNVFTNDRIGGDGPGVAGPVTSYSANGNTSTTAGAAVTGQFGSIVINADGSYTYTLNNADPRVQALLPGETLTETVSYTLTDHDGDTSTSTLTITISGANDDPTLTVTDTNGGATGQLTVSERGLNDPADTSETADGSLAITAPDGIASVDIHGTVITLAQLQAATPASPITIETDHGQIVITGFTATATTTAPNGDELVTAGTVTYTYTLTQPLDHVDPAERTDVVPVKVTDRDGSTVTGALTVLIQDDTPDARPDSNTIAEDALSNTVGGNVFANDRIGGDGPIAAGPVTSYSANGNTSTTAGTAVTGQFGSIVINADGSYTYTLDNTNPTVNALNTGDSLTETVSYTITDHDGDTSTATLTLTIQGHTEGEPTITPVDGNGPDTTGQATVSERGLVDTSGSERTTGAIDILTPLGLGSVTIGGREITLAELLGAADTPILIPTPEGVLAITGFTPVTTQDVVTGGRIDYDYTLTQTVVNAPGATEATEPIALVVTQADAAATRATGTLVVRIVDDVPEAVDDTARIAEDGAPSVSGSLKANDTPGADAANGVPVTSVSFGAQTVAPGTVLATQYGSIVVQADGSYIYTLDNSLPAVQRLVPGETLTDSIRYTLTDNDGDSSTAQLVITIDGSTDPVSLQIVDNNGGAPGQATVDERGLGNPADPGETGGGSMVIGAPDGVDRIVINGTTVPIDQLQNLGNAPVVITTGIGTLTLTGYDPATGVLVYGYTLDRNQSHAAGPVVDDIAVTVFDRDGDSATGTLSIEVLDDVPLARDDLSTLPGSDPDNRATVTGNVFSPIGAGAGDVPDRMGADASATPISGVSVGAQPGGPAGQIGVPLRGLYGLLTLNADGRYSYTVDVANPLVVQLNEDQTLTEVYTYTLTDSDGDSSTATLTIVVRGGAVAIPKGDQYFLYDDQNPLMTLTQDYVPALHVQPAVRESAALIQTLSGQIGDGQGLAFGAEIQSESLRAVQNTANLQYVSRDAVAFSQQVALEGQGRARGTGNGLVVGAESLFNDFSSFEPFAPGVQGATGEQGVAGTVAEQAGAAAPVAAADETTAEAVASKTAADAIDIRPPSERDAGLPAAVAAEPPNTAPRTLPTRGALSFSEQLAAMAARQGSVIDISTAALAHKAQPIKVAAVTNHR